MRKLISLISFVAVVAVCKGQNQPSITLYDTTANALEQIVRAVEKAGVKNKHVLIQIGGNWCPWCMKLHNFINEHPSLDSLVKADYILIRVNYSKENKNPEAMAALEYPQRFGFPVLVILDEEGNRLHTQNTLYLEEEEYYSEKRIKDFLLNWNPAAVNPETYH